MRAAPLVPHILTLGATTLGATVLVLIGFLWSASGAPVGSESRLVQSEHQVATSGTTLTVSLRQPTRPGGLLVAYIVSEHGGNSTLADDLGNTWTSAVGPTTAPDGMRAQTFYACVEAAGEEAITVTFETTLTRRAALYVHEYAGLDPLEPFGAAVAATGTSEAMEIGPLATETAGELLFIGAASNGSVSAFDLPGPWKARAGGHGDLTLDTTAGAPGPQSFTAVQSGSAWSLQLVAFRAKRHPRSAYPLEVGPTGRYLVDQQGRPFFITGDSPQALVVNLSRSEAEDFLANREAAGFNSIWVNLLCSTYTGGRPDGSTIDGVLPFTRPNDLSTPNEAYFARVDHILNRAAAHGMTVFLDPIETGSFLAVM